MIKTKELTNPGSCLNKAHDDEMLFVLRANDPIAPMVVRHWADSYREKHEAAGTFDARRREKYEEAVAAAQTMAIWRSATRATPK